MNNWKYENLGLISYYPPHIQPDISFVDKNWPKICVNGRNKHPLYIKWTDQFDCGYKTEWWYLIKDDEFDISKLKAKRRYEINKGTKNFVVKKIDPKQYLEDINRIREALFAQYPEEYRKDNDKDTTNRMYKIQQNNNNWITIGAFSVDNGMLCGYADINICDGYLDFVRLCVDPSFEKLGINFAIVNGILEISRSYFYRGYYICDGQRSIRHKTAFQEWLVKYFGFRYAYCRLNIKFSRLGKLMFSIGKALKSILKKSNNKHLYKLLVFVKLGEIAESFNE